MQFFSCVLRSALLWRLVHSSAPTPHLQSNGAGTSQSSNGTSRSPLLQLMSLSLDNWGFVHAAGKPKPATDSIEPHGAMRQKLETSRPPLLALMSLDLDNWGSKVANSTAHQPFDKIVGQTADNSMNPLARVLPSESNLFDPRGFQPQSMSFFLEPQHKNGLKNLGMIILILLVLVSILSCLCWDGGALGEQELHSPSKEEQVVQGGFATVEFSDGSWSQVYRDARGEQKEALELLFRCNIISTEEFAFSQVDQDHIQESLWIATHMLRQKPLEEWVALWTQAQQTFEDHVTACFEARGGPHSDLASDFDSIPPMAVPSLPPLSLGSMPVSGRDFQSRLQYDEDEDDPYTTRSHYSPHGLQDPPQYGMHGMRLPDTQESQFTVESGDSRWSIESELDNGLAMHGLK